MFSTLDNAVTLVHAGGATDIGQWPRILLALSGLAAGFIFDIKNRKYMGIVMYCIMVLSTICVAILKFAGPFMAGLIVFYLSAGFFVVFFLYFRFYGNIPPYENPGTLGRYGTGGK